MYTLDSTNFEKSRIAGQLEDPHHTTEEELRAFVAGRLAAFKVPVKIVFWPETLPHNANGKIMKTELKTIFAVT